jgi:hypothetical protein
MTGKRKTLTKFIEDVKLVHGDKYDYSLVNYINSHTKVKIICSIHGEFEQRPHRHLQGDGCKECAKKVVSKKNSLSLSEFINKSKSIHGDKYDYTLVEYVNNKTKVKIICPIHGEFEQAPTSHLNTKCGCPNCGKIKRKFNKTKTLGEFIEDAKLIHGDKYDYSKTEYKTTNDSIDIICKLHGSFSQKPYKHLQNQGCPTCKESKLEKTIRLFLNENHIKYIIQYGKKENIKWLGNQSLDFFLIDYNVAIECQGEQHFKVVDFGNKGFYFAKSEFDKIVKRDKEKFNKCKKNNVKIFYFTDDITYSNIKYFDRIYFDKIEMLNNIKNNYGKQ